MSCLVVVSPYTPEDYPAICGLWQDAGWGRPDQGLFPRVVAAGGVVVVAHPGGADPGGPPCGAVSLVFDRGCALVQHLAIAPSVRRQGVATVLLRAVESAAVAKGVRTLKLDCIDSNEPATALYRREGWEQDRFYNGVRGALRPLLVRVGLRRPPRRRLVRWRKKLTSIRRG